MAFLLLTCSCAKSKRDKSLTLVEYQSLGIPDPETTWGLAEYTKAFQVLGPLKLERPYVLPVKDGNESDIIYNRLTDSDNLGFVSNESMSLTERAHRIKEYMLVYTRMVDIYTNILMKKQYYHQELVGIHLFGLDLAGKMLDLADRINESERPDDVAMQYGYGSIQGIYSSILLNLLRNQDGSDHTPEDLEALNDGIYQSVSIHKEAISSESATEMIKEMEAIIRNTSSSHLKNQYNGLISLLTEFAGQDRD